MKKRTMQLLSICMAAAMTVIPKPNVIAADVTDANSTQYERMSETEKVISSPVLITEIVPNTENVGTLNGYEYYELTNVSDKDVDLSNYNIVYVNGSKQSIWKSSIQVIPVLF